MSASQIRVSAHLPVTWAVTWAVTSGRFVAFELAHQRLVTAALVDAVWCSQPDDSVACPPDRPACHLPG